MTRFVEKLLNFVKSAFSKKNITDIMTKITLLKTKSIKTIQNSVNTCYTVTKQCNISYKHVKEVHSMYTVFDVANWFLQKEPMDQKKLQKLCYYAQAWSYALNGRPAFDGNFEAWVHGPVNRTLWNRFRTYGYQNIDTSDIKGARHISDGTLIELLEDVWVTYGNFTGWQLENLTHTESPWINAREGFSEFEPSDRVIDVKDMREYYHSLISQEGIGE